MINTRAHNPNSQALKKSEKAVLLAGVIYSLAVSVPYAYIDSWRLLGVPGINYVAATLLLCAVKMATRTLIIDPRMLVLLIWWIWLSVLGLVNITNPLWSLKLFLTDVLYTGLLPIGYSVGRSISLQAALTTLAYMFIICSSTLLLICILLVTGVLVSYGNTGRLIDPAQYTLHFVASVTLPAFLKRWEHRRVVQNLAVIGLTAIGITFSLTSATRSSLIFTLLTTTVAPLIVSGKKSLGIMVICALLAYATYVAAPGQSRDFALGNIADRFLQSDTMGDLRFAELTGMLDQLEGHFALGYGFGVGFFSPITSSTEGFADIGLAPHIGIFTYLYKGGAVALLLYISLQIVGIVRSLKKSSRGKSFAAVMLIGALAISLISGGYGIAYQLLLGVALGISFSPEIVDVHHEKRYKRNHPLV
jgi:hypothetical protein